jgi:single-strand DNA-binding protein
MFSLNKVSLIGLLGADPVIKEKDNNKMAFFSLATSESWKDKDTGEYKDKTEWHKIVIYNNNIAKMVENNLKKGNKVYVEGALTYRKYQDNQGIEKDIAEINIGMFNGKIVLLEKREKQDDKQEAQPIKAKAKPKESSYSSSLSDELDDEIPF